MNGKKAKAMRRIARQQTVGFDACDYTSLPNGATIVDAKSTRGVVNYFKKQVKRGAFALRKGSV